MALAAALSLCWVGTSLRLDPLCTAVTSHLGRPSGMWAFPPDLVHRSWQLGTPADVAPQEAVLATGLGGLGA